MADTAFSMGAVKKPADGLGARPGVDGGDGDRRTFELRVLLDRELVQGPPADQHDHQVDDDRQHRVLDEDVGEGAAWREILIPTRLTETQLPAARTRRPPTTSTPSRSLNDPAAATLSPGCKAVDDQDFVPERRADLDPSRLGPRLAVRPGGDHEHVVAGRAPCGRQWPGR